MRRLAGAHELLDGPLDDEAALRGNLRDLGRINRWLGGTAAATALSMSCGDAFATSASGCSVDGSTVVNVAPPAASRNFPSTNRP